MDPEWWPHCAKRDDNGAKGGSKGEPKFDEGVPQRMFRDTGREKEFTAANSQANGSEVDSVLEP